MSPSAPRLILASASPARCALLRSAGLEPEVIASNVVEDGIGHLSPKDAVKDLAVRKAQRVAKAPEAHHSVVIGCDSLLEFENEAWGKPSSPAETRERWKRMRGKEGLLHTGHCVIDTNGDRVASATDTALVRFGNPTDVEIERYARTSEARAVAGPFTLEGLSSPWIDSIDGNYGTITGISLPLLRRLLAELGHELVDFWHE